MIGLLVGHNQRDQGAVNCLGESEFNFNQRIAHCVFDALKNNGIDCVILYRPIVGGYSFQCYHVRDEAKFHKCKAVISLHFNAGGGKGCEVLVAENCPKKSIVFADLITDLLAESYGMKQRGNDGVKVVDHAHRGAYELYALRDAGIASCIVEPAFDDGRKFFENESKYVDALVSAIKKVRF